MADVRRVEIIKFLVGDADIDHDGWRWCWIQPFFTDFVNTGAWTIAVTKRGLKMFALTIYKLVT